MEGVTLCGSRAPLLRTAALGALASRRRLCVAMRMRLAVLRDSKALGCGDAHTPAGRQRSQGERLLRLCLSIIDRINGTSGFIISANAGAWTYAEAVNTLPSSSTSYGLVPLWLKVVCTLFVLVLVPVYWADYGPTNFLYFCDIALLITVGGMWAESSLAVSMAAVGIVVPQAFWCIDFIWQCVAPHSGMTAYMFDANKPLFLRGLSFFHGWLPILLVYLVARLKYDRRALLCWSGLALVLCLIAYFLLPPAGTKLPDPNTPINVNYVFGLDDAKPQSWLPPGLYLVAWMLALFLLAYLPAHLILGRLFGTRTPSR